MSLTSGRIQSMESSGLDHTQMELMLRFALIQLRSTLSTVSTPQYGMRLVMTKLHGITGSINTTMKRFMALHSTCLP